MDKFLYLTKSLSRTKRKDYENYVVNAIYFRVGNKDLYPVSQQCVKGSNGKFYYIDLYFPQLKIAIECDEAFHTRQQNNDMLRELDIIRQLTAVDVFNTIELDDQKMGLLDVSKGFAAIKNDIAKYTELAILRIDVSKPYEDVERQIDQCVEIIRDRISKNGLTDIFGYLDPETYYKNKKTINISDNIVFKTNNDVCNIVLGKNYNGNQKQMILLSEGLYAWLPTKMDVNRPNSKGYSNKISKDGTQIFETTSDLNAKNKRVLNKKHIGEKRVVFAKTKDPVTNIAGYRFIGVFEGKRYKANGTLIYERIAEEFEIIIK